MDTKHTIVVTSRLTGLRQAQTGMGRLEATARSLNTTFTKNAKLVGQTTKAFRQNGVRVLRTTSTFAKGNKQLTLTFDKTAKGVKNVTQSMKQLGAGAGGALGPISNVTKALARAVIVAPIWLAFRSAMLATLRLISSSVGFLKSWEYQMAQIGIVVNKSASELGGLSSELLTLSKRLGISNKDLGEGAKLFAQQGRAISEILPLLNATAQLSLLTGRNITQSVEDLTAVLKAYKIEAKDSINIVDSITNVMLNNAITAGDLASAYKQVASTASVFGISLSALTGYITAVKTVTRDAGGKIGQTFRTMFTRLTTSSKEAIQDLTQIPLFLDQFGNATTEVTSDFRNLETVISELASKFKTLGDVQKAQLAKLLGGVRRTNQIIALFDNFDQATKASIDSLFGFEKAGQAVNILTDTMELRVKRLTGTWQEFTSALADTSGFKSAIGGITELIETFTFMANNPEFRRLTFLTKLNEDAEKLSRENKLAGVFLQAEQRFKQLQESLASGRILPEQASEELNLWILNLTKASKILGVNFNPENVQDISSAIAEMNRVFNEVATVKAQKQLESFALESEKEIVNLSAQIRKLNIGEIFQDIGRGSIFTPRISTKEIREDIKFVRDLFESPEEGFETRLNPEALERVRRILDELGISQNKITADQVKLFNELADKIIETGQERAQALSSEERKNKLIQGVEKEREKLAKKRLTAQKTEAGLLEEVFQKELDSIALGESRLETVTKILAILEKNENVDSDRLRQMNDSLRKEQRRLVVARERFNIDLRNQSILNKSRALGASELQVAVQELALADATNKKYEDRLKLQQKVVNLMQVEEVKAQDIILKKIAQINADTKSGAEIIKQQQALREELGRPLQGTESFQQKAELAQTIVATGQKPEDLKGLDEVTRRLIRIFEEPEQSAQTLAYRMREASEAFKRQQAFESRKKFEASLRGLSPEDRLKAREGRIRVGQTPEVNLLSETQSQTSILNKIEENTRREAEGGTGKTLAQQQQDKILQNKILEMRNNYTINVNLAPQEGESAQEFSDRVAKAIADELQRREQALIASFNQKGKPANKALDEHSNNF